MRDPQNWRIIVGVSGRANFNSCWQRCQRSFGVGSLGKLD